MHLPYGHRHSIRLAGYDYAASGFYFVTIVTQSRWCLLGCVEDGQLRANLAGQMVETWFRKLPDRFLGMHCDAFICMPNHVHFVLEQRAGGDSLTQVVQWYKTMTTNHYIRSVKQHGWPRFEGRLWQRNYWERIVRDDSELHAVRQYIANNPAQWELDMLNPNRS